MNAISGTLPRGYTTTREDPPQRGGRKLRKYFTVESCPLQIFRKGARFGVDEVLNKYFGMLDGGCFTENTVLIDHQGVRKMVKKGKDGYFLLTTGGEVE